MAVLVSTQSRIWTQNGRWPSWGSDSVCLQLSHGICISNKIPDDTDDAGRWSTLWEALVWSEPTWSVWEASLESEDLVSAPQHFWISFQGEPEPPRSLGGPSSFCHCPKAQANPSSGCSSLPDTTWGCGSDQEFQQEAGQREHTGDDEYGHGQRASREYPSRGAFCVHLSRLSLSQNELPALSHAWKACVYSWWFSPPDVTTGELAWLERVMVGQKTEIFNSSAMSPIYSVTLYKWYLIVFVLNWWNCIMWFF